MGLLVLDVILGGACATVFALYWDELSYDFKFDKCKQIHESIGDPDTARINNCLDSLDALFGSLLLLLSFVLLCRWGYLLACRNHDDNRSNDSMGTHHHRGTTTTTTNTPPRRPAEASGAAGGTKAAGAAGTVGAPRAAGADGVAGVASDPSETMWAGRDESMAPAAPTSRVAPIAAREQEQEHNRNFVTAPPASPPPPPPPPHPPSLDHVIAPPPAPAPNNIVGTFNQKKEVMASVDREIQVLKGALEAYGPEQWRYVDHIHDNALAFIDAVFVYMISPGKRAAIPDPLRRYDVVVRKVLQRAGFAEVHAEEMPRYMLLRMVMHHLQTVKATVQKM